MIAESAVKVNRKVVNERLVIALIVTASYDGRPYSLVATGSFGGGLSPPPTI